MPLPLRNNLYRRVRDMAKKRVLWHKSNWINHTKGQADGFPPPPGPGPRRAGRPVTHFDYPVHPLYTESGVTVCVADVLGGAGDAAAAAMRPDVTEAVKFLQTVFKGYTVPTTNLLMVPLSGQNDGSGGAYHYGCDATDLYCDASLSDAGMRTVALWVAEASEVMQAVQAKGWDCGASHGEGLSRLHAEACFPSVLDDYNTFRYWLDGKRPNWVDASEPTDTNAESTGCAVGFLFWLASKGIPLDQITGAAGENLAQVYKNLTGSDSAWDDFSQACQDRWTQGQPSGINTDDPWMDAPPQPPVVGGDYQIVIGSDLPAGTYCLTLVGDGASKSKLSPADQSAVLALVRSLLDSGANVEQVLAFLQSLQAILQAQSNLKKESKRE